MAEKRTCPSCGAEMPSDARAGLCDACLLAAGLPDKKTVKESGLADTIAISFPLTERPGDRIGRYKLLKQIGEGGMGQVWLAERSEDVRLRVALKVIKPGMDSAQVLARFEAERQALALMDHPNIAKVLDAGATESGRPYFVMELVQGRRITDYCDEKRLPMRQRLALFGEACHAIQHAHQKGIIHRDIKPSNVLVTEYDGKPVVKIIDFGIAKATGLQLTEHSVVTQLGAVLGTAQYMSPEQAGGNTLDIDTRSDIYSLGVLLYELLTGSTPLTRESLERAALDEVFRLIREAEPPKPSTRLNQSAERLPEISATRGTDPARLTQAVRGDLDWIVMKTLEKDRNRRYETANGLAMDIERHLNQEPVVACPPSFGYVLWKLIQRNKLAFAAASAVAASLILGLGLSTWLFFKEKAARAEAEAAATETKMTLSLSDFLQAARLVSEDHCGDALAYLKRSLSANPTNDAALFRIETLLTYHSWALPALTLKHSNRVTSAQFSPDGKRIVTASADKTARVWDAHSGQPLAEPLKHNRGVQSAQFSPDGKGVVTVSYDSSAWVWNAQSGQPPIGPLKHSSSVWSAQFSPDGKRILTASSDGTARVWDAQSGQPLTEPLKHIGSVRYAQFSPEGKRIVTTFGDQSPATDDKGTVTSQGYGARVWDAQSGQPLTEPLKHNHAVLSAQFSPDGKWIVTASFDGTARVWDAQSGQPLTEPLKHSQGVQSAQFSPDGRRIVTASEDNTARVWDAHSGLPLTEPLKHDRSVHLAQFSPDGKRIVTLTYDQTARVWDAHSGLPLAEPLKHTDHVLSAQFSPDGKWIVTASMDQTARAWDAHSGQPLSEPLKHNQAVRSARFSPDGKWIVTASEDNTARVWDAQSGRPLTEPLKHSSLVWDAQFSPDGGRIVTTFGDQSPAADDKGTVTTSQDYGARVWDAQSGQPLPEPLLHNGFVGYAQFSPDWKRIVTFSSDWTARVWTARVWDAHSGLPLTEPLKHNQPVRSAQFSPDGNRVLTASGAGSARVWDAHNGQPLTEPLAHNGFVNSAQFSPDGKRIVTASQENTARVWDAHSGLPLTEPLNHDGSVNWAQFSPDGKRILTASGRHARVWDAQSGQPLTEPLKHSDWLLSAQFSPDGKRIVTVWSDHTARVWDVGSYRSGFPDWLLQLSEAVSGQVLNKHGVLQETSLSRGETIRQIRENLSHQSGDDDWVVWGRWFLADPSTRTISPLSKITVPQYLENRIKENTAGSLAEAERLVRVGGLEESAKLKKYLADASRKRHREQAEQYRKAAEGGQPPALNKLAWFLATCSDSELRDGPTAVALAERAVQTTDRKNAIMLDTLAAAYAETGQFPKAINTQNEAIAISQNEQRKREFTFRLKLYESGSPYRQPDQ